MERYTPSYRHHLPVLWVLRRGVDHALAQRLVESALPVAYLAQSESQGGRDGFRDDAISLTNLRRIMDEQGLKQVDIVRGMKISNATASQWVNGSTYPRIGMMKRLADFLNVPVTALTSGNQGDPELSKFKDLLSQMTDDDKRLILLTMQRLVEGRK